MRMFAAAATLALLLGGAAHADVKELEYGAFVVEKTFTLPAPREEVWEGLTGDVSAWWDHTFSGDPYRLYIEAWPGGGFYEIFDDSGDGVRHAEVLAAKRGETLTLRGPLGFSGHAIDIVYSFTLEDAGDRTTRLNLVVRASGEVEEGWAAALDRVWDHFIDVRLRGWLAGESPAD